MIPKQVFRIRLVIWLTAITVTGFFFKFMPGEGKEWFHDYGAGVLYVTFWILFWMICFPRPEWTKRIALGVLVLTCVLETLQLWKPAPLQEIRRTFIGGALLGTDFDRLDFPHYMLGAFFGYLIIQRLTRQLQSDL